MKKAEKKEAVILEENAFKNTAQSFVEAYYPDNPSQGFSSISFSGQYSSGGFGSVSEEQMQQWKEQIEKISKIRAEIEVQEKRKEKIKSIQEKKNLKRAIDI